MHRVLTALLALLLAAAPVHAADATRPIPPGPAGNPSGMAAMRAALPPVTAAELASSLLAEDSCQVAHLKLQITVGTGPDGKPQPQLGSRPTSIGKVDRAWVKRFVTTLLPANVPVQGQPCPPPLEGPEDNHWLGALAWRTHDGGGQVFVNFASGCAMGAILGRGPTTIQLGTRAPALMALFREAIPKETGFKLVKAPPPGTPSAATKPPAKAPAAGH